MTVGPRIGPDTSATGLVTIWVRRIGPDHFAFWAWPDRIAIYRIPETDSPQLIHTFRKEN